MNNIYVGYSNIYKQLDTSFNDINITHRIAVLSSSAQKLNGITSTKLPDSFFPEIASIS